MTPATKDEFARLTECYIKIGYIEKTIEELRKDLNKHIDLHSEKKREISDRRLAIYIATATILGSAITGIVTEVILPSLV